MKYIQVCLIALVFFVSGKYTTTAQVMPKINYIYLWDVTWSMKGVMTGKGEAFVKAGGKRDESNPYYKKEKDIWEDVKKNLIESIKSIPDGDGKIIIIPFETNTYPAQTFVADKKGKENAIKFIELFDNDINKMGKTNICLAWESAFNYIDKNSINLLYLYTDGEQSDCGGKYDKGCEKRVIDNFCNIAKDGGQYVGAVVVALNELDFPEEVKERLCSTCPKHIACSETGKVKVPEVISILPVERKTYYNAIDDDGKLKIHLKCNNCEKLPEDFHFNVEIQDSVFGLGPKKQTARIKYTSGGYYAELEVKIPDNFKYNANEEEKFILNLKPVQDDEKYVIDFLPPEVELIVFNKKEKILNIRLKEDAPLD